MNAGRFLRFGMVGALGFLVDVAVLYLALAAGLGLYAGRVVSFLGAATFTWALNRRFTFAVAERASVGEWARFLAANASGGVVNYLVYAGLVTFVALCARVPALAVAAGSIAGLAVNYAASERFVFNRRGPAPRE